MDFQIHFQNNPLLENFVSILVMVTVIVSPVMMVKIMLESLYCFCYMWQEMVRYVRLWMTGKPECVQDYPEFQREMKENTKERKNGLVCNGVLPSNFALHQNDNGSSFLPSLRMMLQEIRCDQYIPYQDLHVDSGVQNPLKLRVNMQRTAVNKNQEQLMYKGQIEYCDDGPAFKPETYHFTWKVSHRYNTSQNCCCTPSLSSKGPAHFPRNGFHSKSSPTPNLQLFSSPKKGMDELYINSVICVPNNNNQLFPNNFFGSRSKRDMNFRINIDPTIKRNSSASSYMLSLNQGMVSQIVSVKLLKVEKPLPPEEGLRIMPSNVQCQTAAFDCSLNGGVDHKKRYCVERHDSECDDFIVFCDVTVEEPTDLCSDLDNVVDNCWSDSGEEGDGEDSETSEDESTEGEKDSDDEFDEEDSGCAQERNGLRYRCKLMSKAFENLCWDGNVSKENRAEPEDEDSEDASTSDYSDSSESEGSDVDTEEEDDDAYDDDADSDDAYDDDAYDDDADSDDADDDDDTKNFDQDSEDKCPVETTDVDEADLVRKRDLSQAPGDDFKCSNSNDAFYTSFPYDLDFRESNILHTDISLTAFRSCTGTIVSFRNPFLAEQQLKSSFPSCDQDYEQKRQKCSTKTKTVTFAPPSELTTVHRIVAWDYAYREARKGHWEQYARDRAHFRRRIDHLSDVIEPVLKRKLQEMM